MEDQVKAYWSKDIAMQLDISTSTLRKWSLALEREGYTFIRDENERRAYIFSDLEVLKEIKKLIHNGVGLEDASKAVAIRFLSDSKKERTLVVPPRGQDEARSSLVIADIHKEQQELKQTIESFMVSMNEKQEQLHQEIAQQRDYIDEVLRKRDEQLMIVLQNTLKKKPWWKFNKK